ncbi:MAG: DUF4189 domain-containing protein [Candidatus Competibacteraceae bacterium]|uniref:DUF4189 domain-containing protein n=1 Tax=Candidatus Contendobacter odensis Run_B_J11 TaxID=1400861 RepID=A0A7U7G7G5_9GAMM|nr:DUF4189 domain-containing protein [Candidatus Competibacteraceae bacterium]CDH43151.1 exported hypothetical protein [Candidatus Contendobacter odensis Run_B_J11]
MRAATAIALVLILMLNAGCAGLEASSSTSSYGAVAYAASTQDWRLHWRAPDPQQARLQALANCATADCQVVLEFGPGQCGTLALGDPGFGIGLGDTPAAAESAALAECQRKGQGCRVAEAECNR